MSTLQDSIGMVYRLMEAKRLRDTTYHMYTYSASHPFEAEDKAEFDRLQCSLHAAYLLSDSVLILLNSAHSGENTTDGRKITLENVLLRCLEALEVLDLTNEIVRLNLDPQYIAARVILPPEKANHPAAKYLLRLFALGELFERELGNPKVWDLLKTWHSLEDLKAFEQQQADQGITGDDPNYRYEPEPDLDRLLSAVMRAHMIMGSVMMLLEDGYTGEDRADYIISRASGSWRSSIPHVKRESDPDK